MSRSAGSAAGSRRARCSIEIGADVDRVFRQWTRYEELPRLMEGVRRTRRIDERRILWDVDVFGRQVVWEAEIVESVPSERIRWATRSGASHAGEVAFDELDGDRTRVRVDVCYRPEGVLERVGARLGLVAARIRRDLERFRSVLESGPQPSRRDA